LTDETKQPEPKADAEPIEPKAEVADPATEEPLTDAAPEPAAAEAARDGEPVEAPIEEPVETAAEGAVDESEAAPPAAEPEPESVVAEAELEAAPETVPETASEPVPEAEPETAPVTVSEAAPEAEPQAAPETEPVAGPLAVAEREGPMTMAELLDDPDNEVKSLKHGDVVEGTVVRIDPDEILVDFGGKSEGVVSNRELMGRRGPRESDESRPELNVGDEVLVYVLQPESPEGHAVLSLRRAGLERKWRAMQERFDAGEIVEARVIDHNKGGLIVDLGVRGFVPISQIVDFPRRPRDEQPRDAAQEIAEKLQPFVGRTLRLKILEVNRKANRLILSEKVALYEERREKRDELFSSLQVGQRVTGVVRSIAPFGVFIDLGGIDGLVHKSELSWNKVNNPETAYAIGEEVEAEVIDINHERGRISLSIRRLQPDPWQESVAKYQIGDVIEGTVTKLVNFGAFVRVEEGLEGLIHISELSNQRVAHPGDVVKEEEVLKLKIISLDSERHRLGLSLKQAEDRPSAAPVAAAPAAPAGRYEDRPPRRDRGRDRRDRDYRPEDAISEPDEGIDNTMAAAFASSGLLDQFRSGPGEAQTPEPARAQAPAEAEPTEAAGAEPVASASEPVASPSEPVASASEPVAIEVEADTAEVTEGSDVSEAGAAVEAAEVAEPGEPEAPPADEAAAAEEAPAAGEEPAAEEAPAAGEPTAAEEVPAVKAKGEPAEAEPAEAASEATVEAEAEAEPAEGAKA
jgi:small subunit ribosomal protein S1